MDIRQLKYFVEICKQKSFSKAARECFISTQGISMSIQRLEKELSLTLFKRSSRGIALTKQAEFLLPRAVKIIELIDECNEYFESSNLVGARLPVSFGVGTIEEAAGVPISMFQEMYSDIQLEIREITDVDCDAAVESGDTELGITVGPIDEEKFDAKLLFSTPHAIIVHKDHELASRKSISVHDLQGIPVTTVKETTKTFSLYKKACKLAGFEPLSNNKVDNILLVYYFVETTNIVGISTCALAARLSRPNLRAIPFDDPLLDWNVYLIKRHGVKLSREAALFEKTVLQFRNQQIENGELQHT